MCMRIFQRRRVQLVHDLLTYLLSYKVYRFKIFAVTKADIGIVLCSPLRQTVTGPAEYMHCLLQFLRAEALLLTDTDT